MREKNGDCLQCHRQVASMERSNGQYTKVALVDICEEVTASADLTINTSEKKFKH